MGAKLATAQAGALTTPNHSKHMVHFCTAQEPHVLYKALSPYLYMGLPREDFWQPSCGIRSHTLHQSLSKILPLREHASQSMEAAHCAPRR